MHVGAHGADGRRLSDRRTRARLFYDRLLRQLRGGRPSSKPSALTNRFRMVFSGNGPIEIEGKTYRREPRSAARQLRAGDRRLLRRHRTEAARRPHLHRRRPRRQAAGRDRQRRVRAQALRQRERARPPLPDVAANGRSRVRGARSSASSRPSHARAVQHTRTSTTAASTCRSIANPFGPAQPGRSSASSRPSSSSRAPVSAPTRWRRACGARSTKADPNLPLYFVGTPQRQLEGFVAQNRIIATMFTIFGVVAVRARRRSGSTA